MRLASILVSALVALSALAAPVPTNNGTQPAIISHQSQTPQGVSGTGLQGRANIPKAKGIPSAGTSTAVSTAPSVQELKKHLSVSPSKVLFYSGPGGYIDRARARAAKMGLKILEDSWKVKTYPDTFQASLSPAEMSKFWDNASQALAELSSGTIYVLVPEDTVGTNFFSKAIWARIEWPSLQKNSAVAKVVKIFPENDKQEIIKGASAGSGSSRPSSPIGSTSKGSKGKQTPPRKNSKS
ncbi:hypothetical protein D9615_007262 [Tricholomella constricta]|uniref:Uncharacterized protein n=1 Tax=Tricholomella constricta TaxID=117010 RepID=A0A8H5M174_9AGAR|nr:hypothetical protein D9615_007262 [Tricholomella constricta]